MASAGREKLNLHNDELKKQKKSDVSQHSEIAAYFHVLLHTFKFYSTTFDSFDINFSQKKNATVNYCCVLLIILFISLTIETKTHCRFPDLEKNV